MKILLTNDDGPLGWGLCALRERLQDLGEVTVVCPAQECSGVSHAITYLGPVGCRATRLADGAEAHVLTGTPVDCVKFAVLHLMDERPDLVVSGLNHGSNAGLDVFYSGTVAAAREGAFQGVLSVAVSTPWRRKDGLEAVAGQALRVVRMLVDHEAGRAVAFNVNIPRLGEREPEIRLTRLSTARQRERYARIDAPRGRVYYWIDAQEDAAAAEDGTDTAALEAGHISITPLLADPTDLAALERLRRAVSVPTPGA